jgi:hypothetical protein
MHDQEAVVPRALLPIAAAEVPLAALAGAILGGVGAGPIGLVVGLGLGAIVGALVAIALERQSHVDAARDRRSDEAIGVFGGTLGAPNLEHPPPRVGAYSPESMGSSSWPKEPGEPASGPMPTADA